MARNRFFAGPLPTKYFSLNLRIPNIQIADQVGYDFDVIGGRPFNGDHKTADNCGTYTAIQASIVEGSQIESLTFEMTPVSH
jgi:hypothetical protein